MPASPRHLPLPDVEKKEWLFTHIPHRVGAVLARCENMKGDWQMPPSPTIRGDGFHVWCICRSIDEGQKAAMRWLIELVGIADINPTTRLPDRPRLRATDVSLERFGRHSIDLNSDEAKTLTTRWKGCSQASVHPTTGTNHPDVNDPELAEALTIVIGYLEKELYTPAGLSLFKIVRGKY